MTTETDFLGLVRRFVDVDLVGEVPFEAAALGEFELDEALVQAHGDLEVHGAATVVRFAVHVEAAGLEQEAEEVLHLGFAGEWFPVAPVDDPVPVLVLDVVLEGLDCGERFIEGRPGRCRTGRSFQ